jgi:hypothetical protein
MATLIPSPGSARFDARSELRLAERVVSKWFRKGIPGEFIASTPRLVNNLGFALPATSRRNAPCKEGNDHSELQNHELHSCHD